MRRPILAVLVAVVVGAAGGGIVAAAAATDPCDNFYDGTVAGEHAYAKCRLDRIEYGTQPTSSPTPTASPTSVSPSPTPSSASPTPTASPTTTAVTVTNITANSATLNWTGTGASGYLVGRDGVDSKGTGAWSTTDPATARSRVFGNLLPGTTYHLFVEPVGGTRVTVTAKTLATATATPTASASSSPTATATPTASPTATGGPLGVTGAWANTFTDDFNGTAVDTNKWNPSFCGTMNHVTIDPKNTTVANGIATLRLAGGKGAMLTTSTVDTCGGPNNPYTLPVGSFAEARVNFGATADGHCANWPAWWASGPNWPAAGEHDIAEVLSGQLTVNYHSSSGAHNQGAIAGNWCGGWHTYGLHRKAGSADVYWDGRLVKTYPTDDNGQGESLILNIGTSGSYPDTTKTLQADYVRAWKPA